MDFGQFLNSIYKQAGKNAISYNGTPSSPSPIGVSARTLEFIKSDEFRSLSSEGANQRIKKAFDDFGSVISDSEKTLSSAAPVDQDLESEIRGLNYDGNAIIKSLGISLAAYSQYQSRFRDMRSEAAEYNITQVRNAALNAGMSDKSVQGSNVRLHPFTNVSSAVELFRSDLDNLNIESAPTSMDELQQIVSNLPNEYYGLSETSKSRPEFERQTVRLFARRFGLAE